MLVARCEHDAVMPGPSGEMQYMNVKTLNEWDPRVCKIGFLLLVPPSIFENGFTMDAQADLSHCWAHRSFCWFCHAQTHICIAPFICNPMGPGIVGILWGLGAMFGHQHRPHSAVELRGF